MMDGNKEVYLSRPWLKHYPEGIAADIGVPDQSIPDCFDAVAARYAGKAALIFYGRKIRYGELKELSDRFAAALADLGVAKGDTVALYLLNCPST